MVSVWNGRVSCDAADWMQYFFFSSRRRHTRLVSDWSSDVCSSDLNAAAEEGTGAILLEADGSAFCAGAECEDEELFTIGRHINKPIVAAVQGVAISGGLTLVANAHVVVAAQGTSFGLTDIRDGLWPAVLYRAVVHALG